MVPARLRTYRFNMLKTKKSFRILPLAFLTLLGSPSFAASPEDAKTAESFIQEINQFNHFLKDVFAANIHLSKEWDNNHPTFSASAMSMSGRVIRVSGFDYRSNTLAAFRLGLCHETGHYLAGTPFLRLDPGSIENTVNRMDLSSEGQADYFAPYCLKKYFEYLKLNNSNSISDNAPSSSAPISNFCKNSKPDTQEQLKCEYVASAALELVNYLNDNYSRAGQSNPPIQFEAYKDTKPTTHTLNGRREYPTLNCRLQTFLAGTLCANDQSPVNQFVCSTGEGSRPDCWYQGNN